jgi:hypothetical protein
MRKGVKPCENLGCLRARVLGADEHWGRDQNSNAAVKFSLNAQNSGLAGDP